MFYVSGNGTLPSFENYAKLYFYAKHLGEGLNRGWGPNKLRGCRKKIGKLISVPPISPPHPLPPPTFIRDLRVNYLVPFFYEKNICPKQTQRKKPKQSQ